MWQFCCVIAAWEKGEGEGAEDLCDLELAVGYVCNGNQRSPPTPWPENRPPSVIVAPRTQHSKKPDLVYEVLGRMYLGAHTHEELDERLPFRHFRRDRYEILINR